MTQTIQAGMLSDISKFLKSISEKLFQEIDKLWDMGIVVDTKQSKDGGVWCTLKINGEFAEMEAIPIKNKTDFMHVTVKLKSGRKIDIPDVPNANFTDCIIKELRKEFPDAEFVKASRTLNVTLKKVATAKDIDIKLTAIHANYDAMSAFNDLNTVLEEESFLDAISEEPTSFAITDTGNTYSISTIDSFDVSDTCQYIIQAAMQLWCKLSYMDWSCIGSGTTELRPVIEEFRWMLMDEINFFGELSVEYSGTAVLPELSSFYDAAGFKDDYGYDACYGFQVLKDMIDPYIQMLDMYYVNFSHDVQTRMDTDIRRWKNTSEYFIKQRLK